MFSFQLPSLPAPRPALIRKLALVSLLTATLAAGVGLDRTVLSDTAIGGQRHESLEDVAEFETLSGVYDLVRENYVLTGDMTDEELINGAATGMLDALNDNDHSYFMDPEATVRREQSMDSELVGIGMSVNWDVEPPLVNYPYAGTPAFDAGILPDDAILAVDGVDPLSIRDVDERSLMMRGDEGTDVTLELRHRGEEETFTVTITRERIALNPVSWVMLPGNIQWLRLESFSDGAAGHIVEALAEGKDAGAVGVILDLRHNGGGWIREAVDIAGQFEPVDSVVFHHGDADGNNETLLTTATDGEWQEGPLVVLVDEYTGSSGELLAATLRDNKRAILVGETTLGLGTSVFFYDLEDGSSIALSIDLWYTPNGDQMLNNGITPHVAVASEPGVMFALPYMFDSDALSARDFESIDDAQLQMGYEVMRNLLAEG